MMKDVQLGSRRVRDIVRNLKTFSRADDDQVKPVKTPALPGLRNLDKVKVKGSLKKDEHGNFTLLAQGIYRVERPELPAGLNWPQ